MHRAKRNALSYKEGKTQDRNSAAQPPHIFVAELAPPDLHPSLRRISYRADDRRERSSNRCQPDQLDNSACARPDENAEQRDRKNNPGRAPATYPRQLVRQRLEHSIDANAIFRAPTCRAWILDNKWSRHQP